MKNDNRSHNLHSRGKRGCMCTYKEGGSPSREMPPYWL